ncbi:unnamed protein product [Nezara viridula]|uniref:Uncharacterized protein n=1 Tax=Nezara viridula TaxID=85310 RepID=A0A9P0H9J7_NEZVI|nr:unnamed protein product [Nezara viridula]
MLLKAITYFTLYYISGTFANEIQEPEEVFGDEGSNLSLPCQGEKTVTGPVTWRHQGRVDERGNHESVLPDNSLSLIDLSKEDAGIYTCYLPDDTIINRIMVNVRTPPPALVNVTIVPSTILANLYWEVEDSGGYPITHFTAQYRLKHTPPGHLPDPWHRAMPPKIKPTATQIDIYQLEPNSTYVFQIWANNKLGCGKIVELEATTKHDNQEIELAKHFLEGAETFDTRVWVAAVAVVMGTLIVLASATIYILYKESHLAIVTEKEVEALELIPNIILNPGYHDYGYHDYMNGDPDENSNDTAPLRLNNNTVVRPIRI